MPIVVDTSSLISMILFAESIPYRAINFALDNSDIITSPAIETEYLKVISRAKFDKYAMKSDRMAAVYKFIGSCRIINTFTKITVCRDETDNKFLELAVDGGAEYIIASDPDLLELHPFNGINILSPAEFLKHKLDFS